jgi:hypothetical protein
MPAHPACRLTHPSAAHARSGAAYVAVSLLGAVVMPHNLYLHSGLVLSRNVPPRAAAVRRALLYNNIESAAALLLSLLINIAVVCVGAAIVADPATSPSLVASLLATPLQTAPGLLRRTLGRGANTFFALALLASGQSSTITGVYAGAARPRVCARTQKSDTVVVARGRLFCRRSVCHGRLLAAEPACSLARSVDAHRRHRAGARRGSTGGRSGRRAAHTRLLRAAIGAAAVRAGATAQVLHRPAADGPARGGPALGARRMGRHRARHRRQHLPRGTCCLRCNAALS